MSKEMPKGGVKELLKSSDGRRYLSHLQEKYKDDLEQPRDLKTGKQNPRFYQLYGKKIKKQKEIRVEQEAAARDEWRYNKERGNFVPGKRTIFV